MNETKLNLLKALDKEDRKYVQIEQIPQQITNNEEEEKETAGGPEELKREEEKKFEEIKEKNDPIQDIPQMQFSMSLIDFYNRK